MNNEATRLVDFLDFSKGKYVTINEELMVPVPNGFFAVQRLNNDGRERLITIIPDGYPLTADPMEAIFALSIPNVVDVSVQYNRNNIIQYRDEVATHSSYFEKNSYYHEITNSKQIGVLFQRFNDTNNPTWNKIQGILLLKSHIYSFHIIANYPDRRAQDMERVNLFMGLCKKWLGNIQVKER